MKQVQVGDEFVAQAGMTVVCRDSLLDRVLGLAGTQLKIKKIRPGHGTVETDRGDQFFLDEVAPYIIRDEYVTISEARLPAPMREKPERRDMYCFLNASCGGSWAADKWGDNSVDLLRFENGIFDKRWKVEAWVDHFRNATKKDGRNEKDLWNL